jgi:general stress protein 26
MDPKAKVYEIIRGFSNAMLVTTGPGKHPESRPMHIVKVEDEGNLWFFTGRTGRVVEEIAEEPDVLLIFQNENSAYLSLRGKARVVKDKMRTMELWSDACKVWFPGGLDDPELALLAVDPIHAEYWDNRGMNKLEYLFESAKACVKGEQPEVSDVDRHAKIKM